MKSKKSKSLIKIHIFTKKITNILLSNKNIAQTLSIKSKINSLKNKSTYVIIKYYPNFANRFFV